MIGRCFLGRKAFKWSARPQFLAERARFLSVARAAVPRRPLARRFLVGSGLFCLGGTASLFWIEQSAREEFYQLNDEALPRVYDAKKIQTFWDEHPKLAIARVFSIGRKVVPFVGRFLYLNYATSQLDSETAQQELAVEFRTLLQNLGPTFIKFGQMLSIRPDVLPPVAVYELQKLCDSVPAYPTRLAREMLKRELQLDDMDAVLEGIEETSVPIAAASLGQVYRVQIKSTGEWVALKIQRPDMLCTVSLDLYLLRKYAQATEQFKTLLYKTGFFAARRGYDVELLDTFAFASYSELDYAEEGKNQEFLAKELIPKIGENKMHVPFVHWSLSSRKVLASEFIDGLQLAKSDKKTINALIPVGVQIYLTQLLDLGFFHSDPHPGNLLVDKRGRLVLIDFGLCANVAQPDTKSMTSAIVHLMTGDVERLLDDAIRLGFLPEDVDKVKLLPALEKIFHDAKLKDEVTAAMTDAAGASPRYRSVERRKRFGAISKDLNHVFFSFPFTVPSYFALITRALIVLEGIALTGDPAFDIFHASYPYARSRAVDVFGFHNTMKILGAASKSVSS